MRRLLLILIACGCAPPDLSGDVRAWMYLRDPETNGYSLTVGEAKNLESLRELKGRDVVVRAATGISEGVGEVDVDEGRPFALDWGVDEDGVVVPADRDSFHALSLYRNLDHVASVLRAHGHVPLHRLTVYYLPRYDNVVFGDFRLLFTDNAAFFSAARGFLIVPSFVLSELPMLLNEGVIAHEYGHAVVHQELFGDALEEPHADSTEPGWLIARRHLLAMHEGVADLIGYVVTGDPDYIAQTADVGRDLSEPKSLTEDDAAGLDTPEPPAGLVDLEGFDPHHQGSILARTVFELWPRDGGRHDLSRLLDSTLAALRMLEYEAGSFTLASFPNALVSLLDPAERQPACDVLAVRFAPYLERIDACGAP